ncbi:MAG TPA: transporter [Prolixibacteraceae bacterium]|jgi:hypothetical protein
MEKNILFALIILICSYGLSAQNVINTDRPDQSDGTHIVEKNLIQLETGLQFSKFDEATNGFDNATLIRFGVTRHFEVRLLNQYSVVNDSNRTSGFRPLTISFKNQLCAQKGLLPKITLVSYFRLPITISPAFKGDHLGYTFTFAGRHDLTPKMKVYSNLGINRDQESTDISYLATLEVNYNVTDRFSSFIEYFGNYAAHTSSSNGMDIGFIYAFKNNFAVDLAVGSPGMNLASNKFISFGISARLPR